MFAMRRHLSNSCPSLSNCSSSWMFRSIATYTPSHLLQNVSSATYSSYSCSYIFSTPPSTPSQFRYFTSIPTEEEDNRTVRQKCDPYGQDGKPLSTEKTQELLDMLAPTWTYDESKKTISRKYRFQLGGPKGPPNALACSHFLRAISAVKATAEIRLKTIPIGGVSFNDIHLASLYDIEAERANLS